MSQRTPIIWLHAERQDLQLTYLLSCNRKYYAHMALFVALDRTGTASRAIYGCMPLLAEKTQGQPEPELDTLVQ